MSPKLQCIGKIQNTVKHNRKIYTNQNLKYYYCQHFKTDT